MGIDERLDAFAYAQERASPDCTLCKGTGAYMYNHNHATICHLCCKHGQGYWQLGLENYGENGGKWCCRAGCGHIVDTEPANE